MKATLSIRLAGLGLLVLATVASSAPSKCCFANRAYAGICEVTLTRGEDCDAVLAYLNNPMSTGKPYCNATRLRGGWRAVSCEIPPEDTPTPSGP